MVYSSDLYIHELDKRAFDALNMFPKFVKLCEAYSANYDEKAARISFLSTALRLSENQMPEVYNLLPPICEKLGIDVPELYYIKSKEMNAATMGSVNPCIYVTSALVEKVPLEYISSILAHECGHIACKHSLYHSIACRLAEGIDNSPLGSIPAIRKWLSPNIVRALLFWDRCSELSADRAAVLCDGNANCMIDALLKIHEYDDVNRDEFIKQALDLKSFVNDSKANKGIEEMLIAGESHPRLATRVYQCYDWENSETFEKILAGYYELPKDDLILEEEVVSATIEVEEKNVQVIDIESSSEIDVALQKVNAELERYTASSDELLYLGAVVSGLISGFIDAAFVGQCTLKDGDIGLSHKQVNNFIQEYAKARGLKSDRLKDAISDLEKAFKVAQDNVWKGAGIGVTAKNHHLADLAHHPTPIGLLSSIVVHFLRVGTFVNKDGEWHFCLVETTKKDVVEILVPAVLTGVFSWLAYLVEHKVFEDNEIEMSESLRKVLHGIAASPMIIEIAKVADNWFGHLVSDVGGSKNTAGQGMGIPGLFLSLFYEIGSLPGIKETGFLKELDYLYEHDKLDLRHEMGIYKNIGKQAIPVIFNDIYTRILYVAAQLGSEQYLYNTTGKPIERKKLIPYGNRTIDRMIMISSMTFSVADTTDAAVHAAIESCGNWALFAGSFVTRFNYVGAGRAAISIVKEISNDKKEAELIHQKLLLTNIKTREVVEQVEAYRSMLEEKVATYIAEDIEKFLNGFDYMQEGLRTGNSDLVIKGNVVIQRVLGKEIQFSNQEEFDELMDSDIALKL